MPFKRIVLLAGEWDTTPLVYNFLQEHFGVMKVMVEQGVPRKEFLKKRIKKLGLLEVGGQVLFQLIVGKTLSKMSTGRIKEIISKYSLSRKAIAAPEVIRVGSLNSGESIEALKELEPDLVIVHGTRIISKNVLNSIEAPFINIHAGITPRYRGSHGAYWALANGDKENCGVTVHLVDPGIDTGNILAQTTIPYTNGDNFVTYPYLQLAEGLVLLKQVIEKLGQGELKAVKNNLDSSLWHHPTLWSYIWKRITKGVK
jgi:folate-dependent phosphoribosylglycinamide formyltransferase PurN